ncbi:MAG: T9SS type A sorting domain-containing protein [Bacteroidia bacterium]
MKKILLLFCLFSSFASKGQWQSCNLSMVEAYCVASNDSMVCVGSSAAVYTSLNNGTTWTLSGSGLPQNISIHNIIISDSLIFAGTFRGVWISSDNGSSWVQSNSGLLDTIIFSMAKSGTDILVGTNHGGVFRYVSGSGTWSAVNIGLAPNRVYSLASDGITLFAGSDSGKVFKSINYGTWALVNSGLPNSRITTLQILGTTLFAGTLNNGVYTSADNGNNWNIANTGLVSNSIHSLASAGVNILAGTDSGIYYSADNGNQWDNLNMNSTGIATSLVRSIAVGSSNIYIALSTSIPANQLWYLPLSEISTNIIKINRSLFFTLYPNPNDGNMVFDYSLLDENDKAELDIYDIAGKLLYKYELDISDNQLSISHKGLNNGIYLYKIKINEQIVKSSKLIIIK